MADDTNRQDDKAPDRQAPKVSRPFVILNRNDYLDEKKMAFDPSALWRAKQKNPGKDLVFHDPSTSTLYVDRSLYGDPQNRRNMSQEGFSRAKEVVGKLPNKRVAPVLYDMPALEPIGGNHAQEAHKVRDDILAAKNVITAADRAKLNHMP